MPLNTPSTQVFQADKSAAPAKSSTTASAPAPKAPKAKKAESSSEGGFSLDPRTVALPCMLGVGGFGGLVEVLCVGMGIRMCQM